MSVGVTTLLVHELSPSDVWGVGSQFRCNRKSFILNSNLVVTVYSLLS